MERINAASDFIYDLIYFGLDRSLDTLAFGKSAAISRVCEPYGFISWIGYMFENGIKSE